MNNLPFFAQDIEKISIKKDGLYTIKSKSIDIETLIQNIESVSGNIFILLSGARDPSTQPIPKFDRWKWKDKFPGITVNISDPSLYSNDKKLRIGWYIGSKTVDYTKEICEVVLRIAQHFNIKREKIFFYGSSAGGFAAIRMSSIIDGSTAIAINPQIDIRKYIQSQYNAFLKHSFQSTHEHITNEDLLRFDATIELKKTQNTKIIYAQNILDHSHFQDQYTYFCNEMEIEHLGGFNPTQRFKTILFSSANGHGAEPNSLFPQLIDDAIKLANSETHETYNSFKSTKDKKEIKSSLATDKYQAFSKSFYICKDGKSPLSVDINKYLPVELGEGLTFFGSHDLRIQRLQHEQKKVIIVGICIDVNSPHVSEKEIASEILLQWEKSRLDFEKKLFSLAGSFIIIIFDKETYIYPDACGTYAVTYSTYNSDFAVSSHPRLVAEIINTSQSLFQKYWIAHKSFSAGGQYYPANLTEFDNCLQLTPNTYISSKQNRIPSRFYPVSKNIPKKIDTVLKRINEIIDAQVINLTSRFKINASLSGGLDSRVTLAALKNHIDEVNFFTYKIRANASLKQDLDVANKLTEHLNLKHQVIDIKYSDKIPEYIYNELEKISPGNYAGADLTWAYTCNFPKDSIHIRSNLMEIIRGYYLKNPANIRNAYTPRKISSLYRGGTRDEFIGVFDQYLRDIQFYKIAGKEYHYSDVFYWEHRMGIFVSNVVRRERPIMDTIMLFNNHELLSLGLSLSLEERRNGDLLWKYMQNKYPEVLDIPFSSGGVQFSSIRHKI